MEEKQIIQILQTEGFSDIEMVNIPEKNLEFGEHTHTEHTVHFIVDGELIVTDNTGERKYRKGSRVEFPAGTKHNARSGPDGCRMLVGTKKHK